MATWWGDLLSAEDRTAIKATDEKRYTVQGSLGVLHVYRPQADRVYVLLPETPSLSDYQHPRFALAFKDDVFTTSWVLKNDHPMPKDDRQTLALLFPEQVTR